MRGERISYQLTQHITTWLKARVGGAAHEQRLDAEELALLRREWNPIRRRLYLIVTPIALMGCLAPAYFIARGRHAQMPVTPPVALEQHAGAIYLGCIATGVILALLAMVLLEFLTVRHAFPGGYAMGRRYWATVHGWLPHRQIIVATAPFVVLLPVFLHTGLAGLTRVDAAGLRRPAWFGRSELVPFSEVTGCTLFSALNAPMGVRHTPNVEVTFRAGSPWRYLPSNASDPAAVTIGQFICDRASITMSHGGTRP